MESFREKKSPVQGSRLVPHTTFLSFAPCLQENIVAFVDQYRTPDQIYIFSELVQGTTLVEYYRNNNNYLTECDARFIFRQICHAVEYIHKHGIIHRDIKSEVGERTPRGQITKKKGRMADLLLPFQNILIDENLKIKLIDFGNPCRSKGSHHQG